MPYNQCILPDIRDIFRKELKTRAALEALDAIPDCKEKSKRGRSEYQQFVSGCLKRVKLHGKEGIVRCAAEWREGHAIRGKKS